MRTLVFLAGPVLGILILITGAAGATTLPEAPADLFHAYLDAILMENWEAAAALWSPTDVTAAERLGIAYTDIHPKYDCASPLVRSLSSLRDGSVSAEVDTVVEHDDLYEIKVVMPLPDEDITVSYYAEATSDGVRLVSPLTYYAQQWDEVTTTYTRIFCEDPDSLTGTAIEALDAFIEETAEALGISADDLETLSDKKILYFLCSEKRVVELTGHPIHGMYDLPTDAIITCHIPHKHELVHLLINYALRELPLYTALFMQEGLACHLGGRWERSPATIAYGGYAVFKYDLATLDDILTFEGFTKTIGTPDIAYPMSALFVGYLMDRMDAEAFKRLYRALSGSARTAETYSADFVRSTVSKYAGIPWGQIAEEFESWWQARSLCHIAPADISSASTLITESFGDTAEVTVGETEDDYVFHITVKPDSPGLFVAVTDPDIRVKPEYAARIFSRYVTARRYSGQRFALRLSPQEVATYNLHTDELVASYILSFSGTPGDPNEGCWHEDTHTYSFAVDKKVFDGIDMATAHVQVFPM